MIGGLAFSRVSFILISLIISLLYEICFSRITFILQIGARKTTFDYRSGLLCCAET